MTVGPAVNVHNHSQYLISEAQNSRRIWRRHKTRLLGTRVATAWTQGTNGSCTRGCAEKFPVDMVVRIGDGAFCAAELVEKGGREGGV